MISHAINLTSVSPTTCISISALLEIEVIFFILLNHLPRLKIPLSA